MQVYSVWDSSKQAYDYYEGGGSLLDGQAKPRSFFGQGQLGITPEEAAPRLPAGTKKVGSGLLPRGTIATLGGSLAGLGIFDVGTIPLIGGAIVLLWLFGGRK